MVGKSVAGAASGRVGGSVGLETARRSGRAQHIGHGARKFGGWRKSERGESGPGQVPAGHGGSGRWCRGHFHSLAVSRCEHDFRGRGRGWQLEVMVVGRWGQRG